MPITATEVLDPAGMQSTNWDAFLNLCTRPRGNLTPLQCHTAWPRSANLLFSSISQTRVKKRYFVPAAFKVDTSPSHAGSVPMEMSSLLQSRHPCPCLALELRGLCIPCWRESPSSSSLYSRSCQEKSLGVAFPSCASSAGAEPRVTACPSPCPCLPWVIK